MKLRASVIVALALFAPLTANARGSVQTSAVVAHNNCGQLLLASYYGGGRGERLARRTANGEVFNPFGLTAAHRTLPMGTHVEVTYAGRSVVVRINDRGPASFTGRSLDLSYGAARAIGLTARGVGQVRMQVVSG